MSKSDMFSDVTAEYLRTAAPDSHPVQDLLVYRVNTAAYTVDGRRVVLDYSPHEKEIARLLERKLGGEIYMVPRVNDPPGVSTPDYLFRNDFYPERNDPQNCKAGIKKSRHTATSPLTENNR